MSATQQLFEVFTRHQIFIQRRAGGISNDVLPILDDMLDSIKARIASQPSDLSVARLTRLSRSIEQIVSDSLDDFTQQSIDEINDFAVYESEFSERAVQDVVNINTVLPSAEQVLASVNSTEATLVSGKNILTQTIEDMFDEFDNKKPGELARIVQAGFIEGRPTAEIARDISRVVNNRTKDQADALVRTATNQAANVARQKVLSDNSDIISQVKWLSTLDARTSDVCMGRDQNVYPLEPGPDSPRPPAHYRCRSLVIPVIDDEFAIDGLTGERASKFGPVSTRTTYNSFLKRQSKKFQDEVLGKERAKLFRSGGLHVDKFTDDDGITYNLDQLRRLEPLAFERAGLED